MELFKASNQWATRPVDERFWTIEEAIEQCAAYRESARQAAAKYVDLEITAEGDELYAAGKAGTPARLSNYAFGQLCQRSQPRAPASFLRQLAPASAARVLNECLAGRDPTDEAHLLLHADGGDAMLLRAAVGERYERLWNDTVFKRCLDLPEGWRVPPARPAVSDPRARPATEADILDDTGFLSVKVGDLIAPAGIYASDHDIFLFMVNEQNRLEDGRLSRGFFLWNSEVGDKSFGVCTFLYDHVCGNHIVWNAKGVVEWRVRHIGDVRDRAFGQLAVEMQKYAESSPSDEEARIAEAKRVVLGASKVEVVEAMLGIVRSKRIDGLSKKALEAAYDVAEAHTDRYGDPTTIWAQVSGLTQYSQSVPYANSRTAIDRAAGKLMTVAF